jgi:outer membrane protein OmpA-like peptidoglycan-associated protein
MSTPHTLATQLLTQAEATTDPAAQRRLLRQSVTTFGTYANWSALAMAYRTAKAYEDATFAFAEAEHRANTVEERAVARGRRGEMQGLQENRIEGVALLHEAITLHPNPPAWMKETARDIARNRVTPQQVDRFLKHRDLKGMRIDAAKDQPTGWILRFPFPSGSAALDTEAQALVDLVGQQLLRPEYADYHAVIIGHTDQRGDTETNLKISFKRASSVVGRLVRRYPGLASRLRAKGMGSKSPLTHGDSDTDLAKNRRVEIRLVKAPDAPAKASSSAATAPRPGHQHANLAWREHTATPIP